MSEPGNSISTAYDSKIEGNISFTQVDAAMNWMRSEFPLADADGLGLLRD